jgi:cell division protein FtsB
MERARRIPGWPAVVAGMLAAAVAYGQQTGVESSKLDQILQQLNQLRQENQQLHREMDDLRREVAGLKSGGDPQSPPEQAAPVQEKIDVLNQRVEDLDTSKVEAAGHFPVKITGVVLMNSYLYAGRTGGVDLPLTAVPGPGQQSSGATFRNTQLGFLYSGSQGLLGAQLTAELHLDFFGGTLNSQNNLARIERADIGLNWADRSLTFALDKPILSFRNPDSLSQLGVAPLANSGNLWLWQPQLRYEERVHFSQTSGLNARLGVYQTNETLAGLPATVSLSPSRPALQGRFAFYHDSSGGRRWELAPGFHVSESLAAGMSARSYAASLDWLIPLAPRIDWTGFAFTGQDLSGLGIAALHQGLMLRDGRLIPVRTRGGWTQLTLHAAARVDLNLIAGLDDDVNRDLPANGVGRNLTYLANLRFRLAPNVALGPEIMQIRTTYLESGILRVNRYDLALGYFF